MSKILIVDDDEMIRKFLTVQFEGRAHMVVAAENGARALELAASETPDLIVMDMNMPVMTGWDAARELKKAGAATAGIPIIALTAHRTVEDQTAAHEAGCDTYVQKPIDPERLFEAVDRVLG